MKTQFKFLCGLALIAIVSAGCSAFVHVPSASLRINPKTGEVSWTSPKDTKLVGLSVTTSSNGNFTATVASWEDILNPTNISASANGQADIIKANGEAVIGGINAAANAAGAMAAATAKTAAKP